MVGQSESRIFIVEVLRKMAQCTAVAVVLQAAAVSLLFTVISPEDIESGAVSLSRSCPILTSTGKPCPTCGVTRGLAAMGHLQVIRAWKYNPIAVLIYCVEWGVILGAGFAVAHRMRVFQTERNVKPIIGVPAAHD